MIFKNIFKMLYLFRDYKILEYDNKNLLNYDHP